MDAAVDPSASLTQRSTQHRLDGLAWGFKFSKMGVAEVLHVAELLESLERKDVWIWLAAACGLMAMSVAAMLFVLWRIRLI